MTDSDESDRYRRGLKTVGKVNAAGAQAIADAFAGIAPDFTPWMISFAYGDLYSRPQLNLRDREIATIAALTTMANARPQLEAHIAGGLNVGLTRQEIVEIIMQMAIYAGVPAAINGLVAARTVFAERDGKEKI